MKEKIQKEIKMDINYVSTGKYLIVTYGVEKPCIIEKGTEKIRGKTIKKKRKTRRSRRKSTRRKEWK
jgi:hypothetical protein